MVCFNLFPVFVTVGVLSLFLTVLWVGLQCLLRHFLIILIYIFQPMYKIQLAMFYQLFGIFFVCI